MAFDRDDEALEHVVAVTLAVDDLQLPEPAVEVDDRHSLLVVELEAAHDGLLGVIGALDDLPPAHVATPVVLGWHVDVVGRATALAHPPAGDAVEHTLGRDIDVDHDAERAPTSWSTSMSRPRV